MVKLLALQKVHVTGCVFDPRGNDPSNSVRKCLIKKDVIASYDWMDTFTFQVIVGKFHYIFDGIV